MFFEAIVKQCQQAKLVWGRELYFDSSAASMRMPIWIRLSPRFAVEAREALQEHLAALFESEAAQPPERQLEEMCVSQPVLLPTRISEARCEELAQENTARHDWIAEEGRQQRDVYGSYQRTAGCGHQYN
jgi:hypothetical protein